MLTGKAKRESKQAMLLVCQKNEAGLGFGWGFFLLRSMILPKCDKFTLVGVDSTKELLWQVAYF